MPNQPDLIVTMHASARSWCSSGNKIEMWIKKAQSLILDVFMMMMAKTWFMKQLNTGMMTYVRCLVDKIITCLYSGMTGLCNVQRGVLV